MTRFLCAKNGVESMLVLGLVVAVEFYHAGRPLVPIRLIHLLVTSLANPGSCGKWRLKLM